MTRTTKILVAVLVTAAAAGAYWFLLLAPKRDEIKALDGQIAAKQVEVEQARQLLASYEQARKSFRANYTKLAALGKAVPADDDVRSLLVQLDDAAGRSGVDFGKIEVGGGGIAGAESPTDGAAPAEGELASAPGTVPFGDSGFRAMPFSFGFTGSFSELETFFGRLERFVTMQNEQIGANGRLLRLESLQLQPSSTGLPNIQAEIGAATYLVPPAQDLLGGVAAPESAQGATPAPTDAAITPPTATASGGAR
jgi:Tfp pilus assembly protein PilO